MAEDEAFISRNKARTPMSGFVKTFPYRSSKNSAIRTLSDAGNAGRAGVARDRQSLDIVMSRTQFFLY